MRSNSLKKLAVAAMVLTGAASAQAQTVPVAQCAITGPGVLVCAGAAVAVHELVQLGNGKKPLGPNGEVMKVVNGAGDIVAGIFGWGGGGGGGASQGEPKNSIRSDRLSK